MKKLFIITLFIAVVLAVNLSAQIELTFIGGLNLGTVKLNDNTADYYYDISMKPGMLFGVETIGGPFIIGGAFIQGGANFKASIVDYEGSETYNYISGYLLYPVLNKNMFSLFGGCLLGKCLGGTAEYSQYGDSGSSDIKSKDINTEFGLLFGADIMFNSTIGARGSYYLGFTDIWAKAPSDYNYKNSGIEISLLYKI